MTRRAAIAAPPDIARIMGDVATAYGVEVAEVIAMGRPLTVGYARLATYHALRVARRPMLSWAEVGAFVGGRDHTTVRDGAARYLDRLATGEDVPIVVRLARVVPALVVARRVA